MKTAVIIIIILTSIVVIGSVLLQESKSAGFSGAIGGGAEQLFGKKRSSGYDKIFHKITLVSSIVLFVVGCLGIVILG